MKGINKNIILLYLLVTFYAFIKIILQISGVDSNFTLIINPLIWLILLGFAIYITRTEKHRLKAKTEKTQTVLITIMVYLIIYYILGMLFGYQNSPYSHDILSVIKNIWSYVGIIVCQEFVRETLCTGNRIKWYWYLLITLLFTVFEINFYRIGNNFIDGETLFKYASVTLLPVLARNMLFTYMAVVGGYGCNLCFRIPIMLCTLLMPLFPDMKWFWTALFDLLIVVIVFVQVNYIQQKKVSRSNRRSLRKEKLSHVIPVIALLILFVSFVAGVFKYMPVAIMSNSMASVIERGDVVVIQKLSDEEKKNLKVNDIIQYTLDGSSVVHRIIKIDQVTENNYVFTTKGDNNNAEDFLPVNLDQIKGKVLFKVKKIGYPSVFLQELFEKSKPDVETK